MSETFDGGCECGAVRYRLSARPEIVNCCHCRDCQRITGSAFAINAIIATEHVTVTHGTPEVSKGVSGMRIWRCGACSSLLYDEHPLFGDAMRFVRVGTLDEAERLPPTAHFFVRSKHPWVTVPDGVPAYTTLPDQ